MKCVFFAPLRYKLHREFNRSENGGRVRLDRVPDLDFQTDLQRFFHLFFVFQIFACLVFSRNFRNPEGFFRHRGGV